MHSYGIFRSRHAITPAGLFVLALLLTVGVAGEGVSQGLPPEQISGEPVSDCRTGIRIYDSDRGKLLLGDLIRDDIRDLLPDWDETYAGYEADPRDLAVLASFEQPVEIVCVLGTWCHDSEREVPRFWKILDEADNPQLELTMVAVGRSSDASATEILAEIGFDEDPRQTFGVTAVPTFVFLVDGVEWGRIIETPEASLERDAVLILAPDDQTPDVPGAPVLH